MVVYFCFGVVVPSVHMMFYKNDLEGFFLGCIIAPPQISNSKTFQRGNARDHYFIFLVTEIQYDRGG